MDEPHATRSAGDDRRRRNDTAGAVGAVAGVVAAIPLLGPALVAGCLSCVGVGAAAASGAMAALPPSWWVAAVTLAAAAVALGERTRARRCRRRAAPARAVVVFVVIAVAAWGTTRFLALPAVDWLTGRSATPAEGPVLP